MSFAWSEFLALAKALHGTSIAGTSRDAVLRTVVGRCYYSAFCAARDSLTSSGVFQPAFDDRDHSMVVLAMRRARLHLWAERLQYMRRMRNQCDYESDAHGLESFAANAIADAEAIYKVLK